MGICLVCGEMTDGCLCEKHRTEVDIEKLYSEVLAYIPNAPDNMDKNPLWEDMAKEFEYPSMFANYAFDLASYLKTPRKEFLQIKCKVFSKLYVSGDSREWFYAAYNRIIDSDLLDKEKAWLKGLMLRTLYMDNKYFEAEKLAGELRSQDAISPNAFLALADFYMKTRRYDESNAVIESGKKKYPNEVDLILELDKTSKENEKRNPILGNGGKEYSPKDAMAKQKYESFMNTIGMHVEPAKPKKLSTKEFPEFHEIVKNDFDSFVAYDFETTGCDPSKDNIIEVGAIKVVNGKIVESDKFIFKEFIKPHEKKLSEEVSILTGIRPEDLENARRTWKVIPDFMMFVGDLPMVGYNNVVFDSKFLRRAGRYSGQVYTNGQFDLLRYFVKHKKEMQYTGEDNKLGTVSKYYGIENPNAHRALADALTTAKLYLKIKELGY